MRLYIENPSFKNYSNAIVVRQLSFFRFLKWHLNMYRPNECCRLTVEQVNNLKETMNKWITTTTPHSNKYKVKIYNKELIGRPKKNGHYDKSQYDGAMRHNKRKRKKDYVYKCMCVSNEDGK